MNLAYELFTNVNDLTIMGRVKINSRYYFELSCSYGHTFNIRCDSLKGDRSCSVCRKTSRKREKPIEKEGYTKGQLKVLEILPHKPYEKQKCNVLCMCGNVVSMYTSNILRSDQTFSCGKCKPYYKVEGEITYFYLSNGLEEEDSTFIIDTECLNLVIDSGWTLHKGYVRESNGNKTFLHRILTSCEDDKVVDHINGNSLDNRKVNLRVVTRADNAVNTKINKNNTSGKMGVYWIPKYNKWRVIISHENKKIHVGYFKIREDAICARGNAEKLYGYHVNHGRPEKANLGEDL